MKMIRLLLRRKFNGKLVLNCPVYDVICVANVVTMNFQSNAKYFGDQSFLFVIFTTYKL